MREQLLEKVTAFVTRPGPMGLELLCFQHPNAGIQLPARTVEPGEEPAEAALREVREEAGLTQVAMDRHRLLGAAVGGRVCGDPPRYPSLCPPRPGQFRLGVVPPRNHGANAAARGRLGTGLL